MAPKTRKTKAPTTFEGAEAERRVPLDKISRGPLSGWRKTRPGRIQELRDSFLGGAFQQSTFGEVCLLRKTDEDETWIIDDGLATTEVLHELCEKRSRYFDQYRLARCKWPLRMRGNMLSLYQSRMANMGFRSAKRSSLKYQFVDF